jgi:hypothetical protein
MKGNTVSTIESFTHEDDARIPAGYRVDLSYDDCPDWTNGSVYCYTVIDPTGEYAAGCGGYYGFEYAKDSAILDAEACGEWAQKDADKAARDAISRGLGMEV